MYYEIRKQMGANSKEMCMMLVVHGFILVQTYSNSFTGLSFFVLCPSIQPATHSGISILTLFSVCRSNESNEIPKVWIKSN